MIKKLVLAPSGCHHSNGGSWRLPGQEQQGGGEELLRSFWTDLRRGRQQVWQCNSLQLQGEEEMRLWREEVKQGRDENALPSNFTGSRVTSGYLAPMLEQEGEMLVQREVWRMRRRRWFRIM